MLSEIMPKRDLADGENDAPGAFTSATKAAINKHGWTEVQFAHKMGPGVCVCVLTSLHWDYWQIRTPGIEPGDESPFAMR